MATEIEIDSTILANDIDAMQNSLNVIKADLDKMYESVRILDSQWNGPANAAFVAQFNDDSTAMEELCNTIQTIIKYLNFAKKSYDECERQVGDIVGSIRI